jgi:hypothetical protein
MGKYELVATLAMSLNIISFATLVHRVHITRNTSTLSWIYLSGIITSQLLFIFYSFVNNAYGILYPTILVLSGLLYIVYIKFIYQETHSNSNKLDKNNK